MNEPTTQADASSELEALEQAIEAEAGNSNDQQDGQSDDQEATQDAPEYGQAFQELATKKGFKSVDDLVNAYQSLESRSTRAEQARSATEKRVSVLESQLSNVQQQQQQSNLAPEEQSALKLLEDTIQRTIDAQLAPLKQQMGAQKVQTQIDAVKASFPWADNNDIDYTLELMVNHPSISMDQAFKMATFDKASSISRTQAQKAKSQDSKNRAFVEGAGSSKGSSNLDYKKMTLDDLERILPKADTQFLDHRGALRQS